MGSLEKSPLQVAFGEFELDLRTRELFVNGDKLDLQEQPFLVLSALLERPGELVTREELTKRLWPADTFVDFEHSLNRVINRLREALHDSAENPRFVETLPRRGYRLIATVRPVVRSAPNGSSAPVDTTRPDRLKSASDGETAEPDAGRSVGAYEKAVLNEVSAPRQESQKSGFLGRVATFAGAIGLGCIAGFVSYWVLSPTPVPHVIRTRQLTTAARIDVWAPVVTDGSRILYLEREGDHWIEQQISVSGGEPQPVRVPFHNTVILDISPDRSTFLIANFDHRDDLMPFWTWPVQGGAPKRIGNITGYMAKWCPDGHSIVYSLGDGIYRVETDGANPRKLISTHGGSARNFAWSPDGRLLGYTVFTSPVESAIWQVQSDGSHLQRIPAEWARDAAKECCGHWSPDGEYFYFSSAHLRSGDVWALPTRKSFWRRASSKPVRLTALPIYFGQALPLSNQHTLLVMGQTAQRATHLQFDPARRQFSSILPNISAWTLSYSPDGNWLAYVSTSDMALIRARADGSEPQVLAQLKYQPNRLYWSPDSKQILFDGMKSDGTHGLLLIPGNGGPATELGPGVQFEPAWSPDGRVIAYDTIEELEHTPTAVFSIHELDLATGKSQLLAGSEDLRDPNWSPDGHYIAATDKNQQKVMLLDRHSGKWTEIANGQLLTERFWSRDGKFLYYEDLLGPNQPIYQIRLSDRKKELLATFENYLHGGFQRGALIAVAPNGSLVCRLDPGGVNIYALDLELH